MFPEASPRGTSFPEEPAIKCFVIPPNSKIENKLRKYDLLDAYESCACSTSGSQTELYHQDDMILFFFARVEKLYRHNITYNTYATNLRLQKLQYKN